MAMVHNLRELREAAGFDINTVAEKIGACRQSLAGWESGKHTIQYRFRPMLAELYGVSYEALGNLLDGHPIISPGSDMVDVTRCKDCQRYLIDSQFCRLVFMHKQPMGYCDSAEPKEVAGND